MLAASDMLLIDACHNTVRAGTTVIRIAGRPVLFALARALAGAWPEDLPRETLIADAFRTRYADESHRARLRVEIGRLRKILAPLRSEEHTSELPSLMRIPYAVFVL